MKISDFRSMDCQKIASFLLLLVGIFSLCSATDKNGSIDIKTYCNNTGMILHIYLDDPFGGAVYARGSFNNPSCRYEREPSQSSTKIPLFLPANDCGTVIQEVNGNIYLSNSIVIQKYNFAETSWDTIRNVSCKFPPPETNIMNDSKVNGKGFYYHPDGLMARMEFRRGADVFRSQEVDKLRVGDEIFMVVHLKDSGQNKDIRVNKCWAFDGELWEKSNYIIELYDYEKCGKSEWMSNFNVTPGMPYVSNILTYASLKAFKFPSGMSLHFTCSVEVCSSDCLSKCNGDELERNDSEVSRKLNKRAVHSTEFEPLPTPLPQSGKRTEITTVYPFQRQKALIDRINYMKATIKAMGSKLVKAAESKSENDASFSRRISDFNMPTRSGRIVIKPSIENRVLEKDNSSLGDNVTEFIVKPWNVMYVFNISRTLIVSPAYELTSRHEIVNHSDTLNSCVSNLRFILITVILVFLIFCLALIIIGLAMSLHRERKKHKIDSFLLYNYF